MPGHGVLLIDDGDLPSLVATALRPDRGRVILLHMGDGDAGAKRRAAAVRDHGAAFGVRRVVMEQPCTLGPTKSPPPAGVHQAHVLLHAAAVAGRVDCSRIVWAHQIGPDASLVGETVQRANMVAELAQLGADSPWPAGLVIDLPVIDLTDTQMVDLAEDTGAPISCFWPCRGDGERPCGSCPGCQRWQRAFDDSGVAWPWACAQVVADENCLLAAPLGKVS